VNARVLKPVVVERPADLTTPVALMKSLLAGDGPCFLLESVEGGDRVARWSFLGARPSGEISGAVGDPFELLKALPAAVLAGGDDLPPFTGGAVGYAGYDAVRRLERLPATNPDPIGLPDAWFGVFDSVIAFDHVKHRLLFVTHAGEGEEEEKRAFERLRELEARTTAVPAPAAPAPARALSFEENLPLSFSESLPLPSFLSAVEKAKEHIRAGDVFQVVLSRRWSAPFDGDPFAVYRALRSISPSPYQYFLRTPHGAIFGASPERLVRVATAPGGATVETIPLAGTRPRGATRDEDLALEKDLLADTKERAEHVMLVDLGRNDLGRVSTPGSVQVRDFFAVERYSHVMHIASRVVGTLAPGRHAVDALAATFPAGTLTGAPKIRAMEIIEDLEPVRRGAYGGAVGYLDFAGNLDVAIAIRTAVVANGRLHVQAGAGIVADSVPESEALECENKARALMRAVARAGEFP
jgi:anthranilate synthase component 1